MPHLDHMETHVISAILNIAQQVQNPPLPPLLSLQGGGTMAPSDCGPRWQTPQYLPQAWADGKLSKVLQMDFFFSCGTSRQALFMPEANPSMGRPLKISLSTTCQDQSCGTRRTGM